MERQTSPSAVLVLIALICLSPCRAKGKGDDSISVLTYNLFLGANIQAVKKARSFWTLPQTVDRLYANVAEVDFRDRAAALVKTIESDPPDVICLQEVALWRRASGRLFDPSDLGTPLVAHDFLDILMGELRRRGLRYSIAASAVNEKARIPSFRYGRLSLVDRNVILVAGDGIEHLDSESGLFSTQRVVRFMGYSFSFRRVGADKGSRAPMRDKRPIWISDHAGVLAKLRFRAR